MVKIKIKMAIGMPSSQTVLTLEYPLVFLLTLFNCTRIKRVSIKQKLSVRSFVVCDTCDFKA